LIWLACALNLLYGCEQALLRTLNGKRDGFAIADFTVCAKNALMKRGRTKAILDEVRAAVERWPKFVAQVEEGTLEAASGRRWRGLVHKDQFAGVKAQRRCFGEQRVPHLRFDLWASGQEPQVRLVGAAH
jgi:hypothetical protein